jgi:hypothetical protein
MRHILLEWILKKRATFGSTFLPAKQAGRPFQSVELSLPQLLLSRAEVRFTQQLKYNRLLTQFILHSQICPI